MSKNLSCIRPADAPTRPVALEEVDNRTIETLTANDVRDLLICFAAAIELDQIRADALPPEKLHPLYCKGMWRRWRRTHIDYIDQLLPTVDSIPSAMLRELAQLAVTCKPEAVGGVLVDLFASAAGEVEEDLGTATQFFGRAIKDLRDWSAGREVDARSQMMQWLKMTDPLRIADDPECGYGGLIPDARH